MAEDMTTHLVTLATFGEEGFQDRRFHLMRLMGQSREYDIDTSKFIWTWDRLAKSELYLAHKDIFTPEHYLGYWIWCPYIILDALHNVDDGDIIFYADSDLSMTESPMPFIKASIPNKIGLIAQHFPIWKYTKKDCLIIMNCYEEKYLNANALWAAVTVWVKCPKVMRFVTDWFLFATNLQVLDKSPSRIEADDPLLLARSYHRCDQSILSLLALKYNIPVMSNSYANTFSHPPASLPFTREVVHYD